MSSVIDLFAGPGGWDIGAHAMGIDPIGLEWDAAACNTRRAAGLRTMECDVAAVDLEAGWKQSGVTGLIASPPCQAFSMAGKGVGRAAIDAYLQAIADWQDGKPWSVEQLDEACGDPRGHLVLEPLRWAEALRPEWIALEQVEPVLPLWQAIAVALQTMGYMTWTGCVTAEQYGVPQTRKRAILLASRTRRVGRPVPTHQRYIAPRRQDEASESLFDLPEPERIIHPDDRDLLPWISMAEALGWDLDDEAGFPRRNDRPGDAAEIPLAVLRSASEPAFALTEKSRSWIRFKSNARSNAATRTIDEPAPTITGGHDHNERVWMVETGNFTAIARDADGERSKAGSVPYSRPVAAPAPTVDTKAGAWKITYNSRGQRDSRGEVPVFARQREITEPAPTIAGQSRNDTWTRSRPATTVACDPRIPAPGHKRNADDEDGTQGRLENAVRVTLEEALVLQSFPWDYPVQGTKTKCFEQVGNAVPPQLALAILREVVG